MQPGDVLTPWVDPRLTAQLSPLGGRGLFADVPVPAGEALLRWGGVVYTQADLRAGKANPESVAVLERDLYLADPADAALADEYFLNHSCDPNAWMLDAVTLAARRPISEGRKSPRITPCGCSSRIGAWIRAGAVLPSAADGSPARIGSSRSCKPATRAISRPF